MYHNIGKDVVQYVPITQQGSVQQLYLCEEASTIDHEYLEDDKPSINFLLIDHHWLTVMFQPNSKPLITIYDSLGDYLMYKLEILKQFPVFALMI